MDGPQLTALSISVMTLLAKRKWDEITPVGENYHLSHLTEVPVSQLHVIFLFFSGRFSAWESMPPQKKHSCCLASAVCLQEQAIDSIPSGILWW